MQFVAVDPGFSGALAFCDTKGRVISCVPMPIEHVDTGSKSKKRIDAVTLYHALKSHKVSFAVIELVSAMPGQGVVGMFAFGRGCGVIEGVLGALDIPIQYVMPQVWKRHHGLLKQPKEAAILKCAGIMGGKHLGAADAVLIGMWKVNKIRKEGVLR